MKKQLLVIALISGMIFGCGKQAGKSSAKKMNGIEFAEKYKIQLPFLDYGNEEEPVAKGSGSRKQKADAVTLSVIEGDLVLSFVSGSLYVSTTSVNAEWAAFQNLTDTTSLCNFNWSTVPAPPDMSCDGVPTGKILRTFTSDKKGSATAYDIHLSNLLTTE